MNAPQASHLAQVQAVVLESPVARRLGLRLEVDQGGVVVHLPFDSGNVTVARIVHGGVIATLADVAAVSAAALAAPQMPRGGATSSIAISYLAAADGCDLAARAHVLRAGRLQTVCRVEITRPDGGAVAQALVTVALFATAQG